MGFSEELAASIVTVV